MSQDFAKRLNDLPEGWLQAMGITITKATADEVRAELTVGPQHLQGYGIVHGGVHCGLIESLASIGAALVRAAAQPVGGRPREQHELRPRGARRRQAARDLHPDHARPPHPGLGSAVLDDQERIVATGRVRLLCLEQDAGARRRAGAGIAAPARLALAS